MNKQPIISKPSALRLFRVTLIARILPAIFLLSMQTSQAGSATWKASPATGDWNTATNWTAGGPPNGSADTATFATSNITGVSLSLDTEVNGIVFNAGASAFTITATPTLTLTISGTGITNNSGITQNFVTAVDGAGNVGAIEFTNSATAGSLTAFTNNGSAVSGFGGGFVAFNNTSTAGNGTFTNNGGVVSGAGRGTTIFFSSSTAGNSTLIANGGSGGGAGGEIHFVTNSTGGTARVEVFGNGNMEMSFHSAPGVAVGSIEGNGIVFLGANKLTVGGNKLSTTFSGVMQDGGGNGGTGGSLTKVGKGKLSLTKANTYTGGTTITKGTLLVKNKTGSATGSGAVQVNVGTLGGTGKINGAVTVGTGTSSGAILLGGNSATSPGTLTVNNTLTFNSLSTYQCVLNRTKAKASEVPALGVTINSNVPFTFVDTGTGTFSTLADGSTFASGGNNFQASYTGGTGNDLTLTVVP